jgi:hypothetical protein
MEEEASTFSPSEVKSLTALSVDQAISNILSDYRYQIKFNQIINDATELNYQWKTTDWFGYFFDLEYPWIFHSQLGWLYYSKATVGGGFWAYSDGLGWWWSNKTQFTIDAATGKNHRYIFLSRKKEWVALDFSASNGAKRYYSFSFNDYIDF